MNERGTSRSDHFRFSLGLDAEHASKDAEMSALNARLAKVRQVIQPLVMGRLKIPAPRSYAVGGGTSGPRLERARTTIIGEVSRDDYDALIQAAGRLPGVRLQGMTSLASSESRASLADQLLKQALETGQRLAQATARALGLRKVELLLIDQRGSIHRPMQMAARMGEAGFRPGEAPKPRQSLTLKLNYCLR
ncbi:SIMPL domain-containing protein [Synechococcus sp. RS9902]|uniref:SIMPL domain-containing protein n=1 Tax=Synechococcus sp. RS9902 TaxID=221345 RepID=UPI002106C162|nr:SIMPL domain-containing protein [Synechococcus sp. RS9902]